VRFAPDEPGRWVFDVAVGDTDGEDISPTFDLTCHDVAGKRGFVRVSARDRRYFELSDGTFFYPVGLNVAWASNPEHYYRKLAEQGANTVRLWMCPWHLPLEHSRAGVYDLAVADQLDAIVELAALHGLRLILVLEYHGMLRSSWAENPYNARNGGPCYAPKEFFTDEEARALFRRRLDYLSARWGYSTALFAWELWNEVDYADFERFEDVLAWHREMARHLKQVDAHGHLVTSSAGTLDRAKDLMALRELDFASVHLYARDMAQETLSAYRAWRALPPKPLLVAEYGADPSGNAFDEPASRLQFTQGLWLTATLPFAGAGLSWWWDTRVDRDNLYPCLGAVVRAAGLGDRRGRTFQVVESQIRAGRNLTARVRGLLSPSLAFFWVYDPERLHDPKRMNRPLIAKAAGFTVEGMLAGQFDVEWWDTRTGKRLRAAVVECTDGTIAVALPPGRTEIAVTLRKRGPEAPRFRPGLPGTK